MTSHHHRPFGNSTFGALAERFARFFGTPKFIIGQSIIVLLWILGNAFFLVHGFDPYPFILLNLAFSTQAAYAAPLILLAQTRQADRDKIQAELDVAHREEIATQHRLMLEENTSLTEAVKLLTEEIHSSMDKGS